jgi:hypothetical protein
MIKGRMRIRRTSDGKVVSLGQALDSISDGVIQSIIREIKK